LLSQVLGNQRIIVGCLFKYLSCQTKPGFTADFSAFQLFQNNGIISRIHHYCHMKVVLSSRTQHGRTSYINVFYCFLQFNIFLEDGLTEGIQIDYHQVNGVDFQRLQLTHMLRVIPDRKNTAMYLWVQGFYPAVQTFGEAGYFTDIGNRYSCILQCLCRSTC
jgi:hypothetical protein